MTYNNDLLSNFIGGEDYEEVRKEIADTLLSPMAISKITSL
jgi:hypothetical protein